MPRHFLRALIFLAVLAMLGAGACIVKTGPAVGHRHHPVQHKKHKKPKKHKHKKHKKPKKHKGHHH